ncbi:MAG: 5'/3'-nucleotidase SurE [Bacteroidota bacterium]
MDSEQTSSSELPYILVTNDDGIDSPGILALVNAMKKLGEVIVVAPDRQQSAVGHALTVLNPLRITPFRRNGEKFGFEINGTPSDCVKLAMSAIVKRKPDLIVSGINYGKNTSVNILYSGTVSAATEGMLIGIPSIAFSLASYDYNADFSLVADYSLELAKIVLEKGLPKGTLLNVNVPAIPKEELKGVKVTRLSDSFWTDNYEMRVDPFGWKYYWFSGKYNTVDTDLEADDFAIENGYISVSPIQFHFTNLDFMENLKHLEKKIF